LLLLIPSKQSREAPLAPLRASVIRIQQWAWHGHGRAGRLAGWLGEARRAGKQSSSMSGSRFDKERRKKMR
jgi:hypothetical protein